LVDTVRGDTSVVEHTVERGAACGESLSVRLCAGKPAVGDLMGTKSGGPVEDGVVVPADPDAGSRRRRRARSASKLVDASKLAVKAHSLVVPQARYEREILFVHRATAGPVDLEEFKLTRAVADRRTENEPSVGDPIENRTTFGESNRVVQREQQDSRSEVDFVGDGCDTRKYRERIRPVLVDRRFVVFLKKD
jgi:hypothetical protein